jgi:hypothetical protein
VYVRPGGSLSSLDNAGTITAPNIGININSGATTGTLTNSGTLQGANYGVFNLGTISKISNSGTISGSGTGAAVFVGTNGVLGNSTGTLGAALVSTGAGALLDGTIVNQGTINQGFLIENQDVTVGAGSGLAVFDGGTLQVVNGDLTFTDGTLLLAADVSVSGGNGDFINSAILGLSGSQSVTGNFHQTSAGTTRIALLGSTDGAYGHLGISKAAHFDGVLALDDTSLAGGLVAGQTFNIFTFSTYLGGFSSFTVAGTNLTSLGSHQWGYGNLMLTEVWTSETMSLTVSTAPEPSTHALVLGGMAAALLRRRRTQA